jgi:hypothetical protein
MNNRKRREKLGNLFFDLVKFILTAVVIGGFLIDTIKFPHIVYGLIISTILMIIAYFITPKD